VSKRSCFICNGTGEMCDQCGEARDVCEHNDACKRTTYSKCEDCSGTGIASADHHRWSEAMSCTVCGGDRHIETKIISGKLANEWGLNSDEVVYLDRQQGTYCARCGANLRTQALALAICRWKVFDRTFDDLSKVYSPRTLEVNEIRSLGQFLDRWERRKHIEWPEYDLQNLHQIEARSFDLVIHSDTLEHVPCPIAALQECRRVLHPEGACIFTVPIVVGRRNKSRSGMPPSYHGDPEMPPEEAERLGLRVYTEFGADAWSWPILAGFESVEIVSLEWPAALALICRG